MNQRVIQPVLVLGYKLAESRRLAGERLVDELGVFVHIHSDNSDEHHPEKVPKCSKYGVFSRTGDDQRLANLMLINKLGMRQQPKIVGTNLGLLDSLNPQNLALGSEIDPQHEPDTDHQHAHADVL